VPHAARAISATSPSGALGGAGGSNRIRRGTTRWRWAAARSATGIAKNVGTANHDQPTSAGRAQPLLARRLEDGPLGGAGQRTGGARRCERSGLQPLGAKRALALPALPVVPLPGGVRRGHRGSSLPPPGWRRSLLTRGFLQRDAVRGAASWARLASRERTLNSSYEPPHRNRRHAHRRTRVLGRRGAWPWLQRTKAPRRRFSAGRRQRPSWTEAGGRAGPHRPRRSSWWLAGAGRLDPRGASDLGRRRRRSSPGLARRRSRGARHPRRGGRQLRSAQARRLSDGVLENSARPAFSRSVGSARMLPGDDSRRPAGADLRRFNEH